MAKLFKKEHKVLNKAERIEKAAAIKAKQAATLARHKAEKLTAAKRRDLDKSISARHFLPKNR